MVYLFNTFGGFSFGPVRDELLRAMLNSDLIGFLLYDYTRNFLTCCKRMLGLEYEFQRGGF